MALFLLRVSKMTGIFLFARSIYKYGFDLKAFLAVTLFLLPFFCLGFVINRIRFRRVKTYVHSGEVILWRTKRSPLHIFGNTFMLIILVAVTGENIIYMKYGFSAVVVAIVTMIFFVIFFSLFCETVVTDKCIYYYSPFSFFKVMTIDRNSIDVFTMLSFCSLCMITHNGKTLLVYASNCFELEDIFKTPWAEE